MFELIASILPSLQYADPVVLSLVYLQAPKISQKVPTTNSSSSSSTVAGFELGFTKDNEVFVGRMAMAGFAASVVGEVRTRVVTGCVRSTAVSLQETCGSWRQLLRMYGWDSRDTWQLHRG
jgi:hypothetical protein